MRAGALAAALALTLTACGGEPEDKPKDPVRFGKTPAPSGTIPVSAEGNQVPDGSRWPNACRYLTDAEIRAMLPQATRFTREPGKVTVYSIWDDKPVDDPSNVAPAGSCLYGFWLKGVTIDDVTSSIKVETVAVAGPRLIERRYAEEKDRAEKAATLRLDGPGGCYVDTGQPTFPELTCREGPLLYTLSGTGYGDMGVPGDLRANAHAWLKHVLAPAAATIAAKVG